MTSKTSWAWLPLMLLIGGCQVSSETENNEMGSSDREFNGKIALDVRDSEPDWEAFTPKRAPEGAPNILFVL